MNSSKPKLYSSILLLEDDPDDRELFQAIIKKIIPELPVEVRVARNGIEGLSLVRQKAPDIIFSDVNMPVMDGFQFAISLYDDFPALKIPIIFMSTADLQKDIGYAAMLNVVHFIRKPPTQKQLELDIKKALSTSYM